MNNPNSSPTLTNFLQSCKHRIFAQLKHYLPETNLYPSKLYEAMRYVVLNGGKRIRPLLVYATGQALGASLESLDRPAAAVELIHCYSLVHDDLPAIDDDNLRRNLPTCHKAYDEATAILVGDALQCQAFLCLEDLEMIHVLAQASGCYGMVAGQGLDLEASEKANLTDLKALEQMHALKTGALLQASIEMGCLGAHCHDPRIKMTLKKFGYHIGLAFQIQDDILDTEGHTDVLGKTAGLDTRHKKVTYTRLLGITKAKEQREQHYQNAMNILSHSGLPTHELESLCTYIINRNC